MRGTITKDFERYVNQIAGRLLAEGLAPSRYTKAEAKKRTAGVVGAVIVHKMIDSFSPEIKKAMIKMKKK